MALGHNEEAAPVETVAPGAYTVIVRGNRRTTGLGVGGGLPHSVAHPAALPERGKAAFWGALRYEGESCGERPYSGLYRLGLCWEPELMFTDG